MEIRKFATWEYLIVGGIGLWIVTWLVTFVAVFVRLAAGVLVAIGVVDLVFFLIGKFRKKNNFGQTEKDKN